MKPPCADFENEVAALAARFAEQTGSEVAVLVVVRPRPKRARGAPAVLVASERDVAFARRELRRQRGGA